MTKRRAAAGPCAPAARAPARPTLLAWALPFLLLSVGASHAGPPAFDEAERRQGYARRDDATVLLFDAGLYERPGARRVVVTGAFRGWDEDMEARRWLLRPRPDAPGLWALEIPDPRLEEVPPGSAFKYRVDEGEWLAPPAGAENTLGGNLVFMPGEAPPRLRAELRGPRAVCAMLSGRDETLPLGQDAYRLVDSRGRELALARVLPRTASEALVVPAEPLDVRRVYYLELPSRELRSLCSFDGWFRELYSDKPLGAHVRRDPPRTSFRVFSPRADRVRLFLYRGPDDAPGEALRVVEMQKDAAGVWEAERPGDLHGVYYDFTVHGPPDPGNSFFETRPVHVSDPYARVNVDALGKSRVWRRTEPATPLAGGRPPMRDVVAYEAHVQDFTDGLPVPDDMKGTFPAMVTPGLTNRRGEPIGFDHLVELGVNVVHLMPVQEYLHYPDEEWRAAFADDPYMIEQGVAEENYQWGYRTTHAFAAESRYRRRGSEHGAEREQFRDLVQAFHDRGMAVIIDLVPNHTGEHMDGRSHAIHFDVLDRAYYYRTDDELELIGPYGNEVKSEERPMVQRWILDQCRHWIEEFGIDGFRIDLAGQIDEQTLRKLRAELGEEVILYGEPWIAPSDPDVVANPDWAWYKEDAPIPFFQDDARNAFKGETSNPADKRTDRGYAGGDASRRHEVMRALANTFPEEDHPDRGVNYLDIHDNWALADRFATHDWDGRRGVDEGAYRVAAGLLFTSLGPVVIHGGSEIMRSKGAAPLREIVKETASGPLHFHGKRDTYNLRRANRFLWEQVGGTPADPGLACDYRGVLAWWKGLIALRRSDVGAVFRPAGRPPEDHYRWFLPANEHLLGYVVGGRVLVVVNVGEEPGEFSRVVLPGRRWRLVADGERVDPVAGVAGRDAWLAGGRRLSLRVPGATMKIWVRR